MPANFKFYGTTMDANVGAPAGLPTDSIFDQWKHNPWNAVEATYSNLLPYICSGPTTFFNGNPYRGFGIMDDYVNYCTANNLKTTWYCGYTGFFEFDNPGFVFPDAIGVNTGNMAAFYDNFMATVAARYGQSLSNFVYFNYCNEGVFNNPNAGTWEVGMGGGGSTGVDWIINTGKVIKKYFPNAIVGINDFRIESAGNDIAYDTYGQTPTRLPTLLPLITKIRAAGVLDFMGLEAYSTETISTANFTSALNQIGAVGCQIILTEYSPYSNGPWAYPENESQVLAEWQRTFVIAANHPSVLGITGPWDYKYSSSIYTKAYYLYDDTTNHYTSTFGWLQSYVPTVLSTGTVVSVPTISSVVPNLGSTSGGTSVVITGTNLTGATAVKFGSVSAASYTVNSSSQITAITPAESAATVSVSVTTAGGTTASGSQSQFTFAVISPPPYPLKISVDKRHLVDQNNNPFMVVADSGFAYAVNLSTSDAQTYLSTRKSQGFNTIGLFLLVLADINGRADGSTYDGIIPFTTPGNITTPNPAYFSRMDTMISLASGLGLQLIIWPMETQGWLSTMQSQGLAAVQSYGTFIGNRYKNTPGIIWAAGNDYQTFPAQDTVVVGLMSAIQAADPGHLQTSELSFLNSCSLDDANFNSVIGLDGIYTYFPAYAEATHCYNIASPIVPFFLIETSFEGENNPNTDVGNPYTCRKQAIQTILSGGVGQEFGNHFTWGFFSGWQSNLNTPGAFQAGYIGSFFSSYNWQNLVPDLSHTFVTAGYGTAYTNVSASTAAGTVTNDAYVTAALSPDGTLGMFYIPTASGAVTVNMAKFAGPVTAQWWDPTNNTFPSTGGPFPNTGTHQFTIPGLNSAGMSDFILVATAVSSNAPVVSAVSPTSGPVTGGTSVMVSGSNFTGVSAVNFGSTPAASFTVISQTSISCTSPALAASTVDLRIVTTAGTSLASSVDQFTFQAAAPGTGVWPLSLPNQLLFFGGVTDPVTNTIPDTVFTGLAIYNEATAIFSDLQYVIQSAVNTFNWSNLDQMYSWTRNNSLSLMWYGMFSNPVTQSWLNGNGLSGSTLVTACTNFISTAAQRYPNIEFINFCNEGILHSAGTGTMELAFGGKGTTGYDWVIGIGRLFRQYFPNAKLGVNDFNWESAGNDLPYTDNGSYGNDVTSLPTWINAIRILKTAGVIDWAGGEGFSLETVSSANFTSACNQVGALGVNVIFTQFSPNAYTGTSTPQSTVLANWQRLLPLCVQNKYVVGVEGPWDYRRTNAQGGINGSQWLIDDTVNPAVPTSTANWLKGYVPAVLTSAPTGTQQTPGYVQTAFSTPQSTTVTVVTVAFPGSQTAGNLNVVVVGFGGGTQTASVSDSNLNVYATAVPLARSADNSTSQQIFYSNAVKGGTNTVTVTFSAAVSFPDIRIAEYAGVKPANSAISGQDYSSATGTSTAVSSGSITPHSPYLIVSAATTQGSIVSGSLTVRVITTPDGDILQDQLLTAGATGPFTANATQSATGPGSWVSQMVNFISGSFPIVTSVTPSTGPTTGGTPVTITGNNFTGATQAKFNISAGTSFSVISATQISCVSPPSTQGGAVDVVVVTPIGTSSISASDQFTYVIPVPSVTSISPTTGPIAGGTAVTITGSNFTGATAVKFGPQSASFVLNTASQITATSPLGTAGTVDVTVTTSGGTSGIQAADKFTYVAPLPVITAVNPTSGSTSGATSVTVTGTGFTGASVVNFGAVPAASFSVVSDTSFTAVSPAGSPGTINITVTTPGGTSAIVSQDTFTYVAPVPTVTGVSPNTGSTSGNTSVVITGTSFLSVSAVKFGTVNASSFTVNSSTQITATSPAESAATVDITVTAQGGTSATGTADHFTFQAAALPVVTGISPTSGATSGGLAVTISGTNFTGVTSVLFGVTAATSVVLVNDSQITCVSPAQAAGTVDVTVTTSAGTSATSSADHFIYLTAPAIVSVSPSSGPTVGGTPVTVTLTSVTAITSVDFGLTAATSFTVINSTQITAVSPPGFAGTVDIQVNTPGGSSPLSSADQFTYVLPPPSVTGISPKSGLPSGGATVVVSGINFTGAGSVYFGLVPSSSFTVNSDSQITALSPPQRSGTVDVKVVTPGGTSLVSSSDIFSYVFPASQIIQTAAVTLTGLGEVYPSRMPEDIYDSLGGNPAFVFQKFGPPIS